MCGTRLAENTGRKKVAKNRHLGTIAQLCRAISSQIRHASTIGKKMLSNDMSSTCSRNMVNLGLLTAGICWRVWATPVNFNGFRVCLRYYSDVAYRMPTKLCAMYGRLLAWYIIYALLGYLASWWNFATCKIPFLSIYAPSHNFLGLYLRN